MRVDWQVEAFAGLAHLARRLHRRSPTGGTSRTFVAWATERRAVGGTGRGRPPGRAPLPRLPRTPTATGRRCKPRTSPGGCRRCGAGSPGSAATARRRRPDRRPQRPQGRGPPAPGAQGRRDPPAARRAAGRGRGRRRPAIRRQRDDAVSSSSTAAACGSPSCAGCGSGDVDLAGGRSRSGARAQAAAGARSRPPAVEAAARAGSTASATSSRRPGDAGRRDRAVRQPARPAAHQPRRAPHPRPPVAVADAPPRPPPHLRHSPSRRWRRPPCRAGAARPRRSRDHPALHSREP